MDNCVLDYVTNKELYIVEYLDETSPYIAIVVGITSENPLLYLQNVASEIGRRVGRGSILIDALLHSGVGDDRFIDIEFTGSEFKMESAKIVKLERNSCLRKKGCSILAQQSEVVEFSILNPIQKKLLLHGVCI